jgi:hypothetical protein
MDIHLDTLLNLPHVTVSRCQQEEGLIFLQLDFLNEGILCPHCQATLQDLWCRTIRNVAKEQRLKWLERLLEVL